MAAEVKETENQGQKTFTQAEMDAIIGDRLARERQKYADYDSLKEKMKAIYHVKKSCKKMDFIAP